MCGAECWADKTCKKQAQSAWSAIYRKRPKITRQAFYAAGLCAKGPIPGVPVYPGYRARCHITTGWRARGNKWNRFKEIVSETAWSVLGHKKGIRVRVKSGLIKIMTASRHCLAISTNYIQVPATPSPTPTPHRLPPVRQGQVPEHTVRSSEGAPSHAKPLARKESRRKQSYTLIARTPRCCAVPTRLCIVRPSKVWKHFYFSQLTATPLSRHDGCKDRWINEPLPALSPPWAGAAGPVVCFWSSVSLSDTIVSFGWRLLNNKMKLM